MHPLTEYPRPAMRRDSYENLNGLWQYAITASAQRPAGWDGEILVPYAPECRASGVGRTLQPGQWLHYHRYFAPPAGMGGRVLLHFGAVDYACAVQVNGHLVGGHRGGYWPFTLDITAQLNGTGRNSLWVAVQDPTGHGTQARGKQTLQPGGMFYPAQSGIWQTVWLERVPENYIQSLTVTPDYDACTVTVKAHTSAPGGAANLWAVVRAGGVTIAEDWGSDEADQDGEVTLHIADEYFFPWSPDTPFLYDLTVGTTQGEEEQFDTVHSYFALRKWSCAPDARGVLRFCLNDKPILLNGLLDQGYWPEGLYTPPSDAAVERELSEVKALGYNLLRKHAKIELQRWYYHCDRLGLVVWQDMVNGGSKYNLWFVTYLTNVLQPLMRRLPDKAALWGLLSRGSESSREEYRRELEDTVQALRCHPCVGCWVPFNEGWGQYDAAGAVQAIRALDDTRLVDEASGWYDQGGGDVYSLHNYFYPLRVRPQTRAVALSEYGGMAHAGARAAPQDLRLRHSQKPGGADRPVQKNAAGHGAAAAAKGAFGAGIHPADRRGGRGERSVHLRPHRHQAGRQRRPFGERRPCRGVCKGGKIKRLWRVLRSAPNAFSQKELLQEMPFAVAIPPVRRQFWKIRRFSRIANIKIYFPLKMARAHAEAI